MQDKIYHSSEKLNKYYFILRSLNNMDFTILFRFYLYCSHYKYKNVTCGCIFLGIIQFILGNSATSNEKSNVVCITVSWSVTPQEENSIYTSLRSKHPHTSGPKIKKNQIIIQALCCCYMFCLKLIIYLINRVKISGFWSAQKYNAITCSTVILF